MRLATGCIASLLLAACSAASNDGQVAGAGGAPAESGGGNVASAGGGANTAGSTANVGGNSVAGSDSGGGSVAAAGGNGAGGMANDGGMGVAAKCDTPVGPGLPGGAPALTPLTWRDISPTQVKFGAGAANTQGMALDPCNPAVLYLCVASNNMQVTTPGVYKSTDAGSTWKKVGHLDTPLHVRVDPKNSSHLYANDGVWGVTQGFFVSTNGGETFTKPDSWVNLAKNEKMFIDDTYDVVTDPSDFNHLLVTFHSIWGDQNTKWNSNAGVLESKDGGQSWIVHLPKDGWGAGHTVHFLYRPELGIGDSNTWLLGTQAGAMLRTTDAGQTWTKVTDVGIQHGGGTIYYTRSGILYATGANQNLKSTDNGVTWTVLGPSGGYNGITGDGTHLYTGRCFGPAPFITSLETDGMTWTNYNSQQFIQGPFEMAFDSTNGIVYSASWQSGMWALKP